MKRIIVSLVAAMLLSPALVMAQNAGTVRLNTQADGAGETCKVRMGTKCYYPFTTAAHSAEFVVESKYADFCLVSSTAAGAVVKVHVYLTAATNVGSLVPTAETTSTLNGTTGDCFEGKQGHIYYFEVDAPPTSGTAVVAVLGRDG